MAISFDLQKARKAVENAKQALKAAEVRFDTECGPDNMVGLIDGIRSAERRLAEARSELGSVEEKTAWQKTNSALSFTHH